MTLALAASVGAGGVQFEEAIRFFRAKTRLPTRAWTDLWEGMHARAFVVAGAMKDELLADFQQAITKALEQGTTLEEFRKDFDRIVAAHGWSYRGGRNWRSAVIYNTNLRMATAAGRWEQIQRLKDRRPFLRYVGVLDNRIRPEHEAWHGTVLPVEHAWWHTHYPPNGWNCRCSVMQLSQADLDRNGWKVAEPPPAIEWEDRVVKLADGSTKTLKVPKGIDTGFAYNVGVAGFGRGAHAKALAGEPGWKNLEGKSQPFAPGKLPIVPAPAAPLPPPQGTDRETLRAELRAALRKVLGGEEAIFTDPLGERTAANAEAIVEHIVSPPGRILTPKEVLDRAQRLRWFPLIPDLLTDPQEIWVGFAADAGGRVALRRRYVKVYDIGRGRAVAIVADSGEGYWLGATFFDARKGPSDRMRLGIRVWPREPQN